MARRTSPTSKPEITPDDQTNVVRLGAILPHRARRQDEPAAASFDTDAEAGNTSGRYAGAPVARDQDGPVDPVEKLKEARIRADERGEYGMDRGSTRRLDGSDHPSEQRRNKIGAKGVMAAAALVVVCAAVLVIVL